MGNVGWFQILIVIVLLVLLFGRNKISDLMGDVAKGVKIFKKGLADEDNIAINNDSNNALESEKKTENTVDHS